MSGRYPQQTGSVRRTPTLLAVVTGGFQVWLRSGLWLIAIGAFGGAGLTFLLFIATGPVTWSGFMAYQNMWVVALGPGLVAAVGAQMARVEKDVHRSISYRSPGWLRVVSGTLVLLWWAAVAYVTELAASFVLYLLVTGGGVGDILAELLSVTQLALTCLIGLVGYAAALTLAGQILGAVGLGGVAVVWVLSGAVLAEQPFWGLVPATWTIRPTLMLIGTHANGTGLEGAVIDDGGLSLIGSVCLAVLLIWLRAVCDGIRVRWHRAGRRDDGPGNPGPESTLVKGHTGSAASRSSRILGGSGAAALRGSGLFLLVLGTLAALIWLRRYWGPDEVFQAFGLLVAPLGAGILSAIAVSRWYAGMRAVATRAASVTRQALNLVVGETLVASAMVIGSTIVTWQVNATLGSNLYRATLLLILVLMLVYLSTLIMACTGSLVTMMISVVGTTAALLIGGNQEFAAAFGAVLPWCWAGTPTLWTSAVVRASLVISLVSGVLSALRLSSATSRMR